MNLLWWVWAGAAVVMAGLWWLQQLRRDAGVVDVGWALLLAASAIALGAFGDGHVGNRLILALCLGGWGLRLGFHLLHDRVLGKPEDGRYQTMRAAMGKRAGLGFFIFFQAQAGFVVLFAVPMVIIADNPIWHLGFAITAVALWLVSLLGEWSADAQLARFRADPASRGKVCQLGWWHYSRHPNYFFEWIHWWGWALLASTHPAWWGWLGWAIPPLMLLFLLKLTGIPYTEARALKTRGEAYARYQRTTSAFIPWFPKKEAP